MSEVFDNKRILVTGATGLLGSNLVRRLLAMNTGSIIAVGRSMSKLESVLGDCGEKVTLLQHDITQSLPTDVGQIDYIFHAAGPIGGKIIIETPADVVLSNVMGTINCLEYLKHQNEKGVFVAFSSATVANYKCNEDSSFDETETELTNSLDAAYAPYTESKRMVEVLANSYYWQYGIPILIGRFSYVYGYSKSMPRTAFFDFIQNAIDGEDVVMTAPVDEKRDNIYVDDAIDGLLRICEKGKYGEAYNISSNGELGNFASMVDIARVIVATKNARTPEKPIQLILKKDPIKKPGIMLNNSKLANLTGGAVVKVSINQGVSAVMDAMEAHLKI